MTIKKRLQVSNILMIAIPILIAIATVVACFLVLDVISGGAVREVLHARRESQMGQEPGNGVRLLAVIVFLLLVFCGIVLAFSTLLSRYVLKRIQQPLNVLSAGVMQISDGNLDYRITYTVDDEFKPVCESFNNMAARLKTSIDEVQKNEESRKELLASISHDLRSPLTSIKAFVEGLLDGVASTPESQREYLHIIKQKTDDINNMVSQLFIYSKMDMGSYPTHPESIEIASEIRDYFLATVDDFQSRGLLVKVSDMPVGRYIFADPLQLRSIFSNILENSTKYKVADIGHATIRCMAENDIVKIVFEDDGPGVREEDIPKIFDVFYRGDASRSEPEHSSGLGLAITAKAIERMNGRVYAENIAIGGLRIVVEIPEQKEGAGS